LSVFLMMFWILASIITLATLAALYYAARGGKVNAGVDVNRSAALAHFKAQLAEIEADMSQGRLAVEQGEAAKAELAREVMRVEAMPEAAAASPEKPSMHLFVGALLAVGVVTLGTYTWLGNPDLPAQPAAGRTQPQIGQVSVEEAVAKVEARLAENPDDVRGWAVLGPIYMRSGRFADAAHAFRQVLALSPPTADAETNLAEAVMMLNQGVAAGEPMALLESAAERDPNHVRSRFYLAGEATRTGDFRVAITRWKDLLALAEGDEPWVEPARNGLATAEAGLAGDLPAQAPTAGVQPDQIVNMVEGLSERLMSEGGSLDEWTRLVRSRLVLGDVEKAQSAYNAAKRAYPDAAQREQLDAMAKQAGLE
jgi:cytochrome c-type biogenesis protein CcmH